MSIASHPYTPGMIHAVVGIMFRHGKVVVRERVTKSRLYEGWWEFPGGKIDPGETSETALAREIMEETGLVADPTAGMPLILSTVYNFGDLAAPNWQHVEFRYVPLWRGEPGIHDGAVVTLMDMEELERGQFIPLNAAALGLFRKEFALKNFGR